MLPVFPSNVPRDPSPTLTQFEAYIAAGDIHSFVGGMAGTPGGGSEASAKIAAWVAATYAPQTVDGVTLYDLTQ